MSARNTNKFLYNPARLPEKDLLARFIVREREFARIWEDVTRTRRDGIDQHFLLIGQRGMGKTTLMLKIAYEVKRAPKLLDWLIPVNLPEELFGVRDLLGLWEVLAGHLEEQFPGLEKQVQPAIKARNERAALEAIRMRLKQEGKKLILFIDNFGDLLDRLNEIEVHRLRETLMSAGDIRLIAASARLMDHTYQYDKPFFDFFNTVFLDGLDRESSLKLMRGLAENSGQLPLLEQIIAEHPARIEAIRRLTGGVPRLLILLFSSVMGDPDAQLMDDLEDILDQVSPYYKHRVEELPDQQQSIFHHVAMAWDAIGAGEVAEAMRTDSRKVSAQLQSLIDNDLLERVETGGKNHLYRVQDRFFNIWYLLRMAGNRGASRMRYLLGFWMTWLEPTALQDRSEELATELMEYGFEHNVADSGSAPWGESSRKIEFHEGIFDQLEQLRGTWRERLSHPTSNAFGFSLIDTATLALWECDFANASALARISFEEDSPGSLHFVRQEFYLLTLLVRYQHQECLHLFESSPHRLKDVFKPIWYALQKLIGEAGRKELLRMGPELEETVDEIVAWVLRMRRKYPA